MPDPHRITKLEQLREVIPPPRETGSRKIMGEVGEEAARYIAQSPLVFVATVDKALRTDVSPKGDHPGFVQVEDAHTLVLPERAGNRLAFGFQNILETGSIALIFVVPGARETLRVNGRATITRDPALLQRMAAGGKPAVLATRIAVEECFFHCGKAFIRSSAWDPASWHARQAGNEAVENWSRVYGLSRSAVESILDEDYRSNL